MATTVRIKNWRVVRRLATGDFAPEETEGEVCLYGELSGHPEIEDGALSTTSPIVGANKEKGVIICLSRPYSLGQPHPDYEAEFRKARQRLLKDWSRKTSKPLVATKKGGRGVIVRNIIGAVACVLVGVLLYENHPAQALAFWVFAVAGVVFTAVWHFWPKKNVPPASQRQD